MSADKHLAAPATTESTPFVKVPRVVPRHVDQGRPAGVVVEVRALAGRRVRHLRSAPGRIVGVVLNPLVMLLVIGYVFRDVLRVPDGVGNNLLYVVPGIALQVGLASIGPSAVSLRTDLDSGMYQRLRSLPVRRSSAMSAHLLADAVLGVAVAAFVLAIAAALGWRPSTSVAALLAGAVLLVVFVLLCGAVGMALGVLVRAPESIDALAALFLVICSFASNLLVDPAMTPSWFRAVAEHNPISMLAARLRDLWGGDGTAVTTGIGSVLAISVTIMSLTMLVLALLSRRLRHHAG